MWVPPQALGFDVRASSIMAFLPWLVMAVGSSLSGLLADTLVARGMAVTHVRKAMQTVAFLIPAGALMFLSQPGISPQVSSPLSWTQLNRGNSSSSASAF